MTKEQKIVAQLVGIFENLTTLAPLIKLDYYTDLGFDEKQARFLSEIRNEFIVGDFESTDDFEREIEDRLNRSGLFDLRYYQERENNEDLTCFDDDLVEGQFMTDWCPHTIRLYITEI